MIGRSFRLRCLALVSGLLLLLPLAGNAGAGGGGGGLPGPQFEGVTSDIDYFLALNAEDEAFDDKSGQDFTSFDKSLEESISGPDGTARSSTRGVAELFLGPGGPVSGTTLKGFSARGFVSGRASAAREKVVPVADSTSNNYLDFSIQDEPTPYAITGSVTAVNNDSDDCSESFVLLQGASPIYHKVDLAGGSCSPVATVVGSGSGILAPGSYSLEAEAAGAVAADYSSASYSGNFSVQLTLFPPCTHESDDTGEEIIGTGGDDVICAEGGIDDIEGRGGDDIILAGSGNDIVDGGGGDDRIFGDRGEDTAEGGSGRDLVDGGEENDDLSGGDGNDIDTSPGNQVTAGVFGGEEDDTVSGDGGEDFVDGGLGEDRVFGGGGPDTLEGAQGPDRVIGQGGNDLMAGGDNPDVMNGGGGSDQVLGQAGADKTGGAAGDDRLEGGTENDELDGDAGEDNVFGGPGEDEIVGGDQKDKLEGQADNDTILAKDGNRDVVSGGPGGNDKAKRDNNDDVSGIETFL